MPYIISTATNATTYCSYSKTESRRGAHNIATKKVVIKGGHGLASTFKNSNFGNVHTPIGVMTYVSDEDFEFLLQNQSFQRHVKAGFITFDKRKVEPEKRVKEMANKDGCAPITPDGFEDSEYGTKDARIYKKSDGPTL